MSSLSTRYGQATFENADRLSTQDVLSRRHLLALAALGLTVSGSADTLAAPQGPSAGQMTFGVHVSLPPAWFDPAETTGLITPFMLLYALHDGLVKAMPDHLQSRAIG